MKEQTLAATIENIPRATAFIIEQLKACGCGKREQMHIDMAIDEILTNIVSYAYPGGTGEMTVRYEFDPSDRMVSITFSDSGIPFDPLQKPDPDITLPAEQRRIGGLGIFMVKSMMHAMKYRRENGKNILTIHKRI